MERTDRNDQRAGSPAGHRITATIIDGGAEVSEIRGRRTYADESWTKQKEVRGAPEETTATESLQKFDRRPVLYIALFRSAILH